VKRSEALKVIKTFFNSVCFIFSQLFHRSATVRATENRTDGDL